ncbi:MAG: hypothetical protein WCW33_04550 [Candidatus Babeliales bacterium]
MYAGFSQLSRITLVVLLGSFFSLSSQVAPSTAAPTASLISPADRAALEKYIKEHSGFNERAKDKNKSNQSSSKKKYWIAGGVTLLVAAIILIWYLEAGKKPLDPVVVTAVNKFLGQGLQAPLVPVSPVSPALQHFFQPTPPAAASPSPSVASAPMTDAARGYLHAARVSRYGTNG